MNRNRRWRTKLARQVVFVAVIIVQSLIAADVYACQCREREPPCSQYRTADVVFVGSVVTIAVEGLGPRQKIVFSIERVVKGLSGSTAELVNYGTSCRYAFAEGHTYLVYAYRNTERNELYTHYCTRRLCLKSMNCTWSGSVQGAVATWSNRGSQELLGNIVC